MRVAEASYTHGLYRVSGTRAYRGHEPGTEFQARLERNAEQRAIARGDIILLDRLTPALEPGSWQLPLPTHATEEGGT
jgi:hypothetical protein